MYVYIMFVDKLLLIILYIYCILFIQKLCDFIKYRLHVSCTIFINLDNKLTFKIYIF